MVWREARHGRLFKRKRTTTAAQGQSDFFPLIEIKEMQRHRVVDVQAQVFERLKPIAAELEAENHSPLAVAQAFHQMSAISTP